LATALQCEFVFGFAIYALPKEAQVLDEAMTCVIHFKVGGLVLPQVSFGHAWIREYAIGSWKHCMCVLFVGNPFATMLWGGKRCYSVSTL
jgi:hypothetical protein